MFSRKIHYAANTYILLTCICIIKNLAFSPIQYIAELLYPKFPSSTITFGCILICMYLLILQIHSRRIWINVGTTQRQICEEYLVAVLFTFYITKHYKIKVATSKMFKLLILDAAKANKSLPLALVLFVPPLDPAEWQL